MHTLLHKCTSSINASSTSTRSQGVLRRIDCISLRVREITLAKREIRGQCADLLLRILLSLIRLQNSFFFFFLLSFFQPEMVVTTHVR